MIQERLANTNVSARQQCMYEGRYRRNLSSVENPMLEANVIVSILYAAGFMLFYTRPVSVVGYVKFA